MKIFMSKKLKTNLNEKGKTFYYFSLRMLLDFFLESMYLIYKTLKMKKKKTENFTFSQFFLLSDALQVHSVAAHNHQSSHTCTVRRKRMKKPFFMLFNLCWRCIVVAANFFFVSYYCYCISVI